MYISSNNHMAVGSVRLWFLQPNLPEPKPHGSAGFLVLEFLADPRYWQTLGGLQFGSCFSLDDTNLLVSMDLGYVFFLDFG